jgi:predicted aminopeptidase
MMVEFLGQAAAGQSQLSQRARPLESVLLDPDTTTRTRAMLQEVVRIKRYGAERGLKMHTNYESFSELNRPYVVWFVNASQPLAFEPLTFTFPIVGSFPGLGWFDESDARAFAQDLKEAGWDVNMRGVTAYSTGGWFEDPILSSMFIDHPAQTGLLVNLLLHESVHATVLVQNQQYFNESLASFVADTLTPDYLAAYYGSESREYFEYRRAVVDFKQRSRVMRTAFERLERVYASDLGDAVKTRYKRAMMNWISTHIAFEEPPNNATLIGFQLYQEGGDEFAALLRACDAKWPRFLSVFDGLSGNHFAEKQTPEIGVVVDRLTRNQCAPLPAVVAGRANSPQLRRHREQQAGAAGD